MTGGGRKKFTFDEMLEQGSQSFWARAETPTGAEAAPGTEVDWTKTDLPEPERKKLISLRLDADVVAFFRAQGKGYQTRINSVLRAYMEAMTVKK